MLLFFLWLEWLGPTKFSKKMHHMECQLIFFLDPGIDLSCSVLKQQHTISLPFHIWWPVCRFTSGPQIDMTKRLMDFNGPCCVWCFILSECPLVCIDWLSIGLGIVFAWMIVHWSSGVAHLGSTWDGAACGMLKDLLPVTTHKFKTGHRTVQTCRMPPSKRPAGHGVTDSVFALPDWLLLCQTYHFFWNTSIEHCWTNAICVHDLDPHQAFSWFHFDTLIEFCQTGPFDFLILDTLMRSIQFDLGPPSPLPLRLPMWWKRNLRFEWCRPRHF